MSSVIARRAGSFARARAVPPTRSPRHGAPPRGPISFEARLAVLITIAALAATGVLVSSIAMLRLLAGGS